MAWIVGANVTKSRHGPEFPMPPIATTVTPGADSASPSRLSPQRASTPALKLSMIASHSPARRRASSRASSRRMSRERLRLLRFQER